MLKLGFLRRNRRLFLSLLIGMVLIAILCSTAVWSCDFQWGEPAEISIYARWRRRRSPLNARMRRQRQGIKHPALLLWFMVRIERDIIRVLKIVLISLLIGSGPLPAVVLGFLLLVCQLAVLGGIVYNKAWLFATVPGLERVARYCVVVVFIFAIAQAAGAKEPSIPMFLGALSCPPLPEGSATLEVKAGRARVFINTPSVLDLPARTEEDMRLAIVLCRHLFGHDGRKNLLTHQQIADSFSKNSRQDCQNHMQKLDRAGGSLAQMILDGQRGRPATLHPEVACMVAQYWERDPLASEEQTCQWLASQGLPSDIPLPTPDELHRSSRIAGNLVVVRNTIRRQLERNGNMISVRLSPLVNRLFELVDAQHRLLVKAGIEPVVITGIVDRIGQSAHNTSCRMSRTGGALLRKLRALATPPSAEQDEALAASVGVSWLEPLHYATLYCVLRLSIGQVAALVGRSKSVVYRGLAAFGRAVIILDAFPARTGFSGIMGIDEKWVRIPKSFSREERNKGKKWRYAYFAVDMVSGDLLHVDVFESNDGKCIRAFLAEVRAKGISPRVVVTDLLAAYDKAIKDTFGTHVTHHYCLFHHLQAVRARLRERCGKDWKKHRMLRRFVKQVDAIYNCRDLRTAKKRLAKVMALREQLVARHPQAVPILDIIQERFPMVSNALRRKYIPMTNNATERVIKAFNQHYKTMAGLESIETARIQLQLFRFYYRLTPMREAESKEHRGKCPLERAGWSVHGIPVADYIRKLSEALDEDDLDLAGAKDPKPQKAGPSQLASIEDVLQAAVA